MYSASPIHISVWRLNCELEFGLLESQYVHNRRTFNEECTVMNRPVGGWLDMQNSRSLMNNLMKLREWSFFLFNSCNMMCLIYDYKLSVNKCPGLPTYYVFTCGAKILPFSFSRISFRCKIGQHASRLLWLPLCTCHQIYRAICHGIVIPIWVGYKWACVQSNVSAETCNEKGWPRDPKIEKII